MPNEDFVSRQWLIDEYHRRHKGPPGGALTMIEEAPAANVYTAHEVAEIIAELYADDCACNSDGNDEWLPEFCEFSQTVCPNPAGVACWEQWLKWREKRKEKPES